MPGGMTGRPNNEDGTARGNHRPAAPYYQEGVGELDPARVGRPLPRATGWMLLINFDELPAAAPARAKPDPRRWHSEMPRDSSDDRVIGGAIDWWCGYPHLQHAIVP